MTTITIEVKKGTIWNICTNTDDIKIMVIDYDNQETEFTDTAPDSVMTDEGIQEYIEKVGNS